LIDSTLARKSKQPKWVTRNLVGKDLTNEFASEHVTRDQC
jgi:hypothetical protein